MTEPFTIPGYINGFPVKRCTLKPLARLLRYTVIDSGSETDSGDQTLFIFGRVNDRPTSDNSLERNLNMATQRTKTKPKESQEDLDASPSRRTKKEEAIESASAKAAAEDHDAAPKKARKPAIQDDVTTFLADTKSNDDAIRKTKKSEYFPNINRKAWDKLLEAKDSVTGGLFRMRLGNMLRGAKSNAAKAEAKAGKAKEKSKD